MRNKPLATIMVISPVSLALASVLFGSLSLALLSSLFAAVLVYARLKFVAEVEGTRLVVERRILEAMPFARQPVPVTVEVLNAGSSPIRGSIEEMMPEGCELAAGTSTFEGELPQKSFATISYSLTPQKRGTYLFEGLRLRREDSFGLFEHEQHVERRSLLSVHTDKKSLETARKLAGKEHLEYSGVSRTLALVMRELEFDSIRDYVSGDRARDIHWKLFSKLRKLMTKVYRKEGAIQTMILVDCSRSMRASNDGVSKLDHSIDLSLQLSSLLLSGFHSVGMALIDEVSVIGEVPPGLGRGQFQKIVQFLRHAPAAREGSPPSPVSETSEAMHRHRAQRQFLSALEALGGASKGIPRAVGLDALVRSTTAHSKGQKQLFIVISDLVSSRDAVVTGSRVCQRTGNRMLVLHTYSDWYLPAREPMDVPQAEELCENFFSQLRVEAQLRQAGSAYLRIGPADAAAGVVRTVRRGKA